MQILYIQESMSQPGSILREKFYMVLGNVGNEGVAVRDRIFIQMDGICQMMIQDITST